MRLFSDEVEGKLDKAYQALGGSRKFGYNPTSKVDLLIPQEDRDVNKIFKNAQAFLDGQSG